MNLTEILQILAATAGALGFGLLFNIRNKSLIAVALGGGLGWLAFILINRLIQSEPLSYFMVSTLISLYAEIMARRLKTPTTVIIIPSMIPLVPGASLYYTMTHFLDGDLSSFVKKALDTLKLASALALGIIVATVITRLIIKINYALRLKISERRREQ